jgi:hypothetical protein
LPEEEIMRVFPFLATVAMLGVATSSATPGHAQVRRWTDDTGRFAVEAQLFAHDEENVTLDTASGQRITVPINRLSEGDRAYLASLKGPIEKPTASDRRTVPRYDQPVVLSAELGLEVIARDGPCASLSCGFPLPKDWPEQKITVVDQRHSANVRNLTVRTLGDGVQQARFLVSNLRRGDSAEVVYTLKIERKRILPPEDTSGFAIPRSPSASIRRYLTESPFIETRHPTVRKEADGLKLAAGQPAWEQVKAIRDHTHAAVKYTGVRALKGAMKALVDGTGDCEERTSVFVALCRLKGVPARSVWIPGHAYAEFYLEDQAGHGYWFPCESLSPAFGEMGNRFIILQKGDNFRDPLKAQPQRYITETAKGSLGRGGAAPVLKPIQRIGQPSARP